MIGEDLKQIFEKEKLIWMTKENGMINYEFKNIIVKIDENYNKWSHNGTVQGIINNFNRSLTAKKKKTKKLNFKEVFNKMNKPIVKRGASVVLASVVLLSGFKKDVDKYEVEDIMPAMSYSEDVIKSNLVNYEETKENYNPEETIEKVQEEITKQEVAETIRHERRLFNPEAETQFNLYGVSIESTEEKVVFEKMDTINNKDDREVSNAMMEGDIQIGSRLNEYTESYIRKFLNTEQGNLIIKYSEMYGIDPYIVLGVAMGESSLLHSDTLPGGKYHNGYAWGIMQHESPSGRELNAYNFQTNSYDTMYVTQTTARNVETNIQMGVMRLQETINEYNGNVLVALQGYNGGSGMPNLVISKFMVEKNMTRDEVLSEVPINEFAEEFSAMSKNPKQYMLTLPEETLVNNSATVNYISKFNTYGTGTYMAKVMSYYLGSEGVYKNINEAGEIVASHYIYETGEIENYTYQEDTSEYVCIKTVEEYKKVR
ncbi:MAG: transglycosylase SLT domain-containing protein [bacterium]